MKTLSRAITAQILGDSQTYESLRAQWGALLRTARRHELGAAHYLLYLALLGKDWRKGFTPPSNPRKLANGALAGWALFRALRTLHSKVAEQELLAPFGGAVTPQMLQRLRQLLPLPNPLVYSPEEFAAGRYPFEAYQEPVLLPGLVGQQEAAHA